MSQWGCLHLKMLLIITIMRRIAIAKNLTATLSIIIVLLSSGLANSAHSLTHFILNKPCPEINVSQFEISAKIKIVQHSNTCSIKTALTTSFTTASLFSQSISILYAKVDAQIQNGIQHAVILFRYTYHWQSPRGPPVQI